MSRSAGLLVSVLTPSFNHAYYLQDCLSSVARQTYQPIEHIVCDAGSTDETLELLAGSPGSVHWISEPDNGQSSALNKAFGLSSGSIIGWLNSDDAYADVRAVELAVDIFQREPTIDVVVGDTLLVNENNHVFQVRPSIPVRIGWLRAVNYVMQPSVFIRRAALERESHFLRDDLQYVMDRELFLRLAKSARWRQLRHPVAIDRHQEQRKVLSTAFADELERFDASIGVIPSRRRALLATFVRARIRYGGLWSAATLAHRIQPAIDLQLPSAWRRFDLQLRARRSSVSFSEAPRVNRRP
jgi:glycosyltransferase involved in cell wall biosynthesis